MKMGRKFRSVMARCRREIVQRTLSLCSAMLRRSGATNTIFFRTILFDSTPKGRLLLSHNGGEAFAVYADDKRIGRDVYLNGEFDFSKVESVVALLGGKRDCGLLIDVGANIGVICIPAVRRGLFKSAIAFEPDPRNFGLLKANIYLNGLASQISAHNIALGAQDGQTLSLTLSTDNYGDHRVQSDRVAERGLFGEESRETVHVASETLDSVVSVDSPAATLIWMDTQGFEGFILAGAASASHTRSDCGRILALWNEAQRVFSRNEERTSRRRIREFRRSGGPDDLDSSDCKVFRRSVLQDRRIGEFH